MWRELQDGDVNREETVLLWFSGAREPVFGVRFISDADGSVNASSYLARGVEFTHWMPLPAAPE